MQSSPKNEKANKILKEMTKRKRNTIFFKSLVFDFSLNNFAHKSDKIPIMGPDATDTNSIQVLHYSIIYNINFIL